MIISQKHKFVYLACPKTASVSIEKVLEQYRDTNISGCKQSKHAPYWEVKEKLKEQHNLNIEDYFVFAFFRNPWDLMVSKYFFHKAAGYSHIKEIDVCSAAQNMDFIKWVKIEKYRWLVYEYPIKTFKEFIDINECRWFEYENLQSNFTYICETLKIPGVALNHDNKSSLRPDKHYSEYYDEEAINAVRYHFKDDIEMIGYEFERK